jgi:hypothetical protein
MAHRSDRRQRKRRSFPEELQDKLYLFAETYRRHGVAQAQCARLLELDRSQFHYLRQKAIGRGLKVYGRKPAIPIWAAIPSARSVGPTTLEVIVPHVHTDSVVIVLPGGEQLVGPWDRMSRVAEHLLGKPKKLPRRG